jgi:YqjK-like protein
MTSPRMKELELRKEILSLKAGTYRMEIEQQMARLGTSFRGIASGLSTLRRLRAHPLLLSAAGTLIARIGPARLLKVAAVAAGGWFAYRVAQASRERRA